MPSKFLAGVVYLVRTTGLVFVILAAFVGGAAALFGDKGHPAGALAAVWVLAASVLSWPRVPDAWRRDPPTDRQLAYAQSLGIVVPEGATKGQVSDMIERAKAGRS